jgi:hypothetical protein
VYRQHTFAELTGQAAHRSLFRDRLAREAGGAAVDQWLVEEANLRGWFGATGTFVPDRPHCAWLTDERLVVGLLMPHGPLDVRLFKLVLRVLQSGTLSARVLWLEARKERAAPALYWLLQQVPPEEHTPTIDELAAAHPVPPRGYLPLPIAYDARRLIKRPATKESTWRAARH